jgi:hypothetical protein
MKKEHVFKKKFEDGSWEIYCIKTTGSFNTVIWKLEKFPNKKCPCCNEEVK